VDAGTLLIAADGLLASSTITVNAGATLNGASRVKGQIVNKGGTVIP
jgi:hypothetical protein